MKKTDETKFSFKECVIIAISAIMFYGSIEVMHYVSMILGLAIMLGSIIFLGSFSTSFTADYEIEDLDEDDDDLFE
jgi:hypothetical protein